MEKGWKKGIPVIRLDAATVQHHEGILLEWRCSNMHHSMWLCAIFQSISWSVASHSFYLCQQKQCSCSSASRPRYWEKIKIKTFWTEQLRCHYWDLQDHRHWEGTVNSSPPGGFTWSEERGRSLAQASCCTTGNTWRHWRGGRRMITQLLICVTHHRECDMQP